MIHLDDGMFELLYNDFISYKPFLMRVSSYHGTTDIRLNKQDLYSLCEYIKKYIKDSESD